MALPHLLFPVSPRHTHVGPRRSAPVRCASRRSARRGVPRILFTRLRTEPHDMLQAIHDALSSAFMRHGFPVLDESAKSWLEEGEEPHDFKA